MDYENKLSDQDRLEKVYDDIGDLQPKIQIEDKPEKGRKKAKKEKKKTVKDQERLRRLSAWAICIVLILIIAVILFSRIFPKNNELQLPQEAVAGVMTPVESAFSAVTNKVVEYLRGVKLRSNIELSYNEVTAANEQLTYENMELKVQLEELKGYKELNDEYQANIDMNPLICNVINREGDNYFSVFTINKGTKHGIEPLMAVTFGGGLVGYVAEARETSSVVRSVIDSDFNIAAIIESSRGQGTISGTLGIDATPMCRMYYYQSNILPRPGDVVVTSGVGFAFPKGIPIGTVRESTRGMQDNKSYIVVEPIVNLESLEYVQVLRYKPNALPVSVQNISDDMTLVATPTHFAYRSEAVGAEDPDASPSPAPEGTAVPSPSPQPPGQTPLTTGDNLEYNIPRETVQGEQIEATPTPEPSPTPEPTVALDELIIE